MIASFDDTELAALLIAAGDLPIECRQRLLVDVTQALAVTRGKNVVRLIKLIARTHRAACMGRISPGDYIGTSEDGTIGARRAVGG